MPNNPYNNKVQLADGTVLIDLSGDTITAGDVMTGITAHDASGAPIVGSLRAMTLAEIYEAVLEGWGRTAIPELELYEYDYRKGYIATGKWTPEDPTNTFVDIYRVTAGNKYMILLGANVGTRFRAMFTTVDITTVSTVINGVNIINVNDPTPYSMTDYTASSDGYLLIAKDNVGKSGIKTHVYSITDLP